MAASAALEGAAPQLDLDSDNKAFTRISNDVKRIQFAGPRDVVEASFYLKRLELLREEYSDVLSPVSPVKPIYSLKKLITNTLRGEPLSWWMQYAPDYTTWEAFKLAFIDRWAESREALLLRLGRLQYRKGGDVAAHIIKFAALVEALGYSADTRRVQDDFLQSIADVQLRGLVGVHRTAAVCTLQQWGEIMQRVVSSYCLPSYSASEESAAPFDEPAPADAPQVNAAVALATLADFAMLSRELEGFKQALATYQQAHDPSSGYHAGPWHSTSPDCAASGEEQEWQDEDYN